jgi:hypothetical protein
MIQPRRSGQYIPATVAHLFADQVSFAQYMGV